MTPENRIVASFDEMFEAPVEVECLGNHPPCNCGWRKIAIAMGYTDVKANTIRSRARRREKARLDQLAYLRYQRPETASEDFEALSEQISEVKEIMDRRNFRNVSAPPRPKPQPTKPQTPGKGGIALP